MSNDSVTNLEFKFVSYKKNKGKIINNNRLKTSTNSTDYEKFNCEAALRRVENAKQDILTSDLYSSVLASLREGLQVIKTPQIKEIVCFGLGKIGECTIARYQLALLLCLRDVYHVKTYVYDPMFNENDQNILNALDFEILSKNLEGKYRVQDTTLFYLPHCPKQLTNNLLWANWGIQLSSCIIIANSFTKILESHPKRFIAKNAEYILKACPYVTEFAVINSFKYYDIFNDTAIHIFPWRSVALVSEDYWDYCSEPQYSDDDLEFVTNQLNKKLEL